ncbi:hypothetical protein ABK905_21340 [Acerihabitans sp. KWT182]|uniref:Uncharacterized protein n=1 Tax=Acerihabitans sp. KWT182 TaxID=3157919 RepID=A0AAU7Q796_9GAMM
MKQLTGKANYNSFTAYSKNKWGDDTDFVDNPELIASSIKYATRSALAFWDINKLYKYADNGIDMDASYLITNIVNPGTHSKESRYKNLIKFSQIGIFELI